MVVLNKNFQINRKTIEPIIIARIKPPKPVLAVIARDKNNSPNNLPKVTNASTVVFMMYIKISKIISIGFLTMDYSFFSGDIFVIKEN